MKPSEIIDFLRGKTREIHVGILDIQQDAFRVNYNDPQNPDKLIDRNIGQISRLIRDTKTQRDDIDAVIAEAKALRSDIERSLSAWEAAGAVLDGPYMPLVTLIKEAAAETDEAAKAVASRGKPRKRGYYSDGFTDEQLEPIAARNDMTIVHLRCLSDEKFRAIVEADGPAVPPIADEHGDPIVNR